LLLQSYYRRSRFFGFDRENAVHIPDGFLNARTCATTAVLSAGALAWAVRRTRLDLPRRKVPLMGLSAAFVFAAMMLNFPVAGGTSGHMVGGVLCSVLLGPSAAVLVITSVLIVQCLVFADGGLLALGANIFNMAVICSVGGYYLYRLIYQLMPNSRGRLAAVAFASWVATVAASIVCAGELAFSGTIAWPVAFSAMASVHMLIGVGEAVMTTLIILAISQTRPDLLEAGAGAGALPRRTSDLMVFGLLISLGLALFVSPFACPWPDGLDHAAEVLGFSQRAHRLMPAPIPAYLFPGIKSAAVATSLAALVGTILAFVLALVLSRILIPASRKVKAIAGDRAGA
jgi:cobalt/nickel transport system permease protein